jgi:poly(3-hydroxyalkanoate) synthetase
MPVKTDRRPWFFPAWDGDRPLSQNGIFGSAAFLWPALLTAEAGRITSALAQRLAELAIPTLPGRRAPSLRWATPNKVVLALPTMQLRSFSTGATKIPTLICAPFALHGSNIADFARGHSLVEVLRSGGIDRLFLTEWLSATPEMRFFSIDSFLADLNVAVDELGGKVDLIGICQGGWMGLLFAARFPRKVRKLVIAGAPIDVTAGESPVSSVAEAVPMSVFEDLVKLGNGRVIGQLVVDFWGPRNLGSAGIRENLQLGADQSRAARTSEARFRDWYEVTVNLPGTYYLQVIEWLFKENRLAAGRFVALGRRIDLAAVRLPVFLLAARDDELVAPGQVLGAARLLGTSRRNLRRVITPCTHMALFMGSSTLSEVWPGIIRWLASEPDSKGAIGYDPRLKRHHVN